jgi:thiol:disulfide interchange protein
MSMRWKGNLGFIAGTAALAVLFAGCARKEPAAAKAEWNTRLDAALADAKAQHRPILLDFYTDW